MTPRHEDTKEFEILDLVFGAWDLNFFLMPLCAHVVLFLRRSAESAGNIIIFASINLADKLKSHIY